MNEVKIGIITDPLGLRDDLNSSWQLLQLESEAIRHAILQRSKDTEQRIGATNDVRSLQRLDSYDKFLKSVVMALDWRDNLIRRIVTNFNSIDDWYWNGVLKRHQLEEENRNLKAAVEALEIRWRILEYGLRSTLNKRGKNGADVGMITSKSNQSAA